MGMGNYAYFADTVEDSFVRETCPKEIEVLEEYLDKYDCSWETLGNSSNSGDIEGELNLDFTETEAAEIVNAYDALCKAFEEKTGLELEICYHLKEDRGDDVDGVFWAVYNVYVLSPAGVKYKDKIERKFWTVYG